MSHASPYPPPASPTKGGKPWLLVLGAVLALLAIVLCCGGGALTFSKGKAITESTEYTGSHTLALEEGDSIAVWSTDDLNVCSATGPAGPVSDAGGASQTITWGDAEYERVMAIDATEAGDYTITCSSPFVVSDSLTNVGFIGMGVGGLLGCLSVVLLVIGFVLWLTRRQRS